MVVGGGSREGGLSNYLLTATGTVIMDVCATFLLCLIDLPDSATLTSQGVRLVKVMLNQTRFWLFF